MTRAHVALEPVEPEEPGPVEPPIPPEVAAVLEDIRDPRARELYRVKLEHGIERDDFTHRWGSQ